MQNGVLTSTCKIEDYRREYMKKWVASKHDQPQDKSLSSVVQQPEAVEDDPEEKRIMQLAERARKGDYDKGELARISLWTSARGTNMGRTYIGATSTKSRLSDG